MERILVDAQSLQTDSAARGIGRYVHGVIIALSKLGSYKVSILLNGLLPNPAKLHSILESGAEVHYFYPPSVVKNTDLGSMLYEQAELFYESAIKSIQPDVLLIGCLTEGGDQDFVSPPIERIKKYCLVVSILYDLIPLENVDVYLPLASLKTYYKTSLIRVASCNLLLCISDYVKDHLSILFPDVARRTIWGGGELTFYGRGK